MKEFVFGKSDTGGLPHSICFAGQSRQQAVLRDPFSHTEYATPFATPYPITVQWLLSASGSLPRPCNLPFANWLPLQSPAEMSLLAVPRSFAHHSKHIYSASSAVALP